MRSPLWLSPVVLAAAIALCPAPARAIHLSVGVGGGSWLLEASQVDAIFRVDQELFSWLRIGLRPGVTVNFTEPAPRIGLNADASIKVKLFFMYVEVFGGAVFLPPSLEPVRPHWGAGVGFRIWRFEFGAEVAYLQPSFVLMGRVSFTFFEPGEKKEQARRADPPPPTPTLPPQGGVR